MSWTEIILCRGGPQSCQPFASTVICHLFSKRILFYILEVADTLHQRLVMILRLLRSLLVCQNELAVLNILQANLGWTILICCGSEVYQL